MIPPPPKLCEGGGYKILKIHSAKEFDTANLFNEYINDMYKVKMNSVGAERWISKLLQNSLYGLFGRKQEIIETLTINRSDIHMYIVTNVIKTIIPIDEYRCTILMVKNINFDMVRELNLNFSLGIKEYSKTINSNVAIASAITAYARIHMIPFKVDPNTKYTDTDSIFTTKKLPDSLIGKDLGLMKDELSGCKISEAYLPPPRRAWGGGETVWILLL